MNSPPRPARDRLAYLVMRFPAVTETFVLREMVEVERQGLPLELYVVIRQDEKVVHPEALPYLDRLHTRPYLSPGVLAANLRWLVRKPRAYLRLWTETFRDLWGTWNFLARAIVLFPKAAAFAEDMESRGIGHVHAHFATHAAYMAYVIHGLTGITTSITAHAHDIFIRKAMLCRKVAAARFVAVISEFNRDWIARHCGEQVRGKIHTVRCGVFPERYAPRALPAGPRDPRRPFQVLTVASLRDYKGIPVLIEACRLVRERIPGLRWELIGGGPDRAALEAQIATAGVGDVLTLGGPKPEDHVAGRLETADAFVLTSVVMPDMRMEGIPVVLMEALASGLPTIATRISGIPELIIDGDTGWLVPDRDPRAVADALAGLYNDPIEAARRGARGRQHVLAEFTVPANVARLRALLEDAIAAQR
ncbi:MAG: glycosyltransferase [Deltaproteobacteria bacterium]|nr:glycosyltransferase [Deltaproteobacteria bacterium]